MMKQKGMRKIVYALCFLLLLQAVSFPVFATPLNPGGEFDTTELSNNGNLSSLIIENGTLVPAFSADQVKYVIMGTGTGSSITATGTTEDANAAIAFNGPPEVIQLGAANQRTISPAPREVSFDIDVTAEDGMVKTYTVQVKKEAKRVLGRLHHLIAERTFGDRTIARFDDSRFGLIVQRDENGLIDYRVPIRSKVNDVRLQIPYGDLMTKITEGTRDLILNYQGDEIRIPMTVF